MFKEILSDFFEEYGKRRRRCPVTYFCSRDDRMIYPGIGAGYDIGRRGEGCGFFRYLPNQEGYGGSFDGLFDYGRGNGYGDYLFINFGGPSCQ